MYLRIPTAYLPELGESVVGLARNAKMLRAKWPQGGKKESSYSQGRMCLVCHYSCLLQGGKSSSRRYCCILVSHQEGKCGAGGVLRVYVH